MSHEYEHLLDGDFLNQEDIFDAKEDFNDFFGYYTTKPKLKKKENIVIRRIKRKRKIKMSEENKVSETNLSIPVQQETELSVPTNIHSFISQQAGAFEQLPYLKILSGNSPELQDDTIGAKTGEFLLMPEKVCLGKEVPVIIGPWRIRAMTIENNKITRVDYNITSRSRYVPERNDWDFPDGLTPLVKEIGESESRGMEILNAVGYDILFYIPSQNTGAIIWIKGTALTMSKIFQFAKVNLGKRARLCSEIAKSSQYSWYLPHLRSSEDASPVSLSQEFKEMVKQFLNPGVVSVSAEEAPEKPR